MAEWATDISDVPELDGDFFSNLTEICEWTETKSEDIPPLILWLAISTQTSLNDDMALVEAPDFLYTTDRSIRNG